MVSVIITLGVWLILHGRTKASPMVQSHREHGFCTQAVVPITATANSAVYNLPTIYTDIDAAAWAIRDTTPMTPQALANILQNTTTSGTFNVYVQLCTPKIMSDRNVLQIATHGVHYDSRYWDSKYQPENYSYVNAALKAGYSILTYDRLGVGNSEILDAYTQVQAPLELEILRQITLLARNGTLYDKLAKSVQQDVSRSKKPKRVVHVGHSFGSILTSAFIANYGNLSDGAILTGYILTELLGSTGATSWAVQAPGTSTPSFDRPSGYVAASKVGIQNLFFGGDVSTAYTPALLDYGNSLKQPVPIGELASAFWIVSDHYGPSFRGPLQYLLPEFDFYVCRGDCKGLANETALRQDWPNAKGIEVAMQPNTGHALTFHHNATAGFDVMFDFLGRFGL